MSIKDQITLDLAEVRKKFLIDNNDNPFDEAVQKLKAERLLASKDWGEVLESPPIPYDILPDRVKAIFDVIMADEGELNFFLFPLLTLTGGIIKRRRGISHSVAPSVVYPNLWTLIIGDTGTGKSYGTKIISKIVRGNDNYEEKINELEKQLAELYAEKNRTKKKEDPEIEQQISEIEIKLQNLYDQKPFLPRFKTNAALTDRLSKGEHGIAHFDELKILLDFFSTDGGLTKGTVIELYDTDTITTYASKTMGKDFIKDPFLGFLTTTTQTWLLDAVSKSDISSGFLTRWIISLSKGRRFPLQLFGKRQRFDLNRAIEIYDEIKKDIFEMGSFFYFVDDEELEYSKVIIYDLQETIHKIFPSEKEDVVNEFDIRWIENLRRLSIIFQTLENPKSRRLSSKALEQSLAVIKHSIGATHYLLATSHLGTEEVRRDRMKVLNYIARKILEKGYLEYEKLYRSECIVNWKKSQYEDCLSFLQSAGLIVIEGTGRDRRIFLG